MMPNIVRGDRMGGLLAYLSGPGRSNEHTDIHLVGGDPAVMAWHANEELTPVQAQAVARHLDMPRTAFAKDVPGGHVWHCSLSLRASEGTLSDDEWEAIARGFVAAMEFDGPENVKAPCRWAAVRHGLSKNGNDHIHIVVNLVREDGTKADIWNDFRRAQNAARALEIVHGLEPLESAEAGRATRGYHPAERHARARARAKARYTYETARGPAWEQLAPQERSAFVMAELETDEPRHALARSVRGCAAASANEAEFVRRLRRDGLIVRPRFAEGSTREVTGYSVAERPRYGERPIWYGGGRLGRDLTLPRLREDWPTDEQSEASAAAEWEAARRGRRAAAPGREEREMSPSDWKRYAAELGVLRSQLREVPSEDRREWARVARSASGALAAWSRRIEEVPGHIAAASDTLAVSAQTFRAEATSRTVNVRPVTGAAMILSAAMKGGRGPLAEAVLLRQIVRLAEAVHDAADARAEYRQAAAIAAAEHDHLRSVAAELPPARLHLDESSQTPSHSRGVAALETNDTVELPDELQAAVDRVRMAQSAPAGSVLPTELEETGRATPARAHTADGRPHGTEESTRGKETP